VYIAKRSPSLTYAFCHYKTFIKKHSKYTMSYERQFWKTAKSSYMKQKIKTSEQNSQGRIWGSHSGGYGKQLLSRWFLAGLFSTLKMEAI
jgi:hypothetical protein